jgi:hypothetical protein
MIERYQDDLQVHLTKNYEFTLISLHPSPQRHSYQHEITKNCSRIHLSRSHSSEASGKGIE